MKLGVNNIIGFVWYTFSCKVLTMGMSMGTTTIKKGVSNNPNGRPRLPKPLTDAYRESRERCLSSFLRIAKLDHYSLGRLTTNSESKAIDSVIASLFVQAIKGSFPAQKEILDRFLGKVTETILLQDVSQQDLKSISSDSILMMINNLKAQQGEDQCKLIQEQP